MQSNLYSPQPESAHGGRGIHDISLDVHHSDTVLYIPEDGRQVRNAGLLEALKTELGVDKLVGWVDHASGDYEILAPDGYEFVIEGKFYVEVRDGTVGVSSPPIPSEEMALQRSSSRYDEDDTVPYGSEFRGTRLCLSISHQDANPYKAKKSDGWEKKEINTSHDGDRPDVFLTVKAPLEAYMTGSYGIEIPFNMYGRDEKTFVPIPTMAYRDVLARGQHQGVSVTLQPVEEPVNGSILIAPRKDIFAEVLEELALPYQTRQQTMAEFKVNEPVIYEYCLHKLGSEDAIYESFRRVYKTPFRDDPVWKAKDLLVFEDFSNPEDAAAFALATLSEGAQKTLGLKLFQTVHGNTDRVDEIESRVFPANSSAGEDLF